MIVSAPAGPGHSQIWFTPRPRSSTRRVETAGEPGVPVDTTGLLVNFGSLECSGSSVNAQPLCPLTGSPGPRGRSPSAGQTWVRPGQTRSDLESGAQGRASERVERQVEADGRGAGVRGGVELVDIEGVHGEHVPVR